MRSCARLTLPTTLSYELPCLSTDCQLGYASDSLLSSTQGVQPSENLMPCFLVFVCFQLAFKGKDVRSLPSASASSASVSAVPSTSASSAPAPADTVRIPFANVGTRFNGLRIYRQTVLCSPQTYRSAGTMHACCLCERRQGVSVIFLSRP